MQTSYQLVKKTLEFDNPSCIACSFPDPHPSDFEWASYNLGLDDPKYSWHQVTDERWERYDEWGNLWARLEGISKGEVVRGALENIDDVNSYTLPDINASMFAKAKEKIQTNPNEKFIISGIPGFTFNIARKIRKLDHYLMDLIQYPVQLGKLHDMIDEWLLTAIENYGKIGAHAIMFPEDWGTQLALMIDPTMWRKVFKPRFKRLCDKAHEYNVAVFMHSCGKVTDIIGDLAETGIDLLQFDQPALHGFETLASFQTHHKLTYWCPVDIQTTLQTKNEARIEKDIQEMLRILWYSGKGGFIAGYYGDNESIGLDPKWQDIACKLYLKHGNRI